MTVRRNHENKIINTICFRVDEFLTLWPLSRCNTSWVDPFKPTSQIINSPNAFPPKQMVFLHWVPRIYEQYNVHLSAHADLFKIAHAFFIETVNSIARLWPVKAQNRHASSFVASYRWTELIQSSETSFWIIFTVLLVSTVPIAISRPAWITKNGDFLPEAAFNVAIP